MGKLVLRLPDGTTRDIELERERVTIGRRADNHICLPYPAVSGEHAAVVTILEDSFLEDLNSTNGTLVNGKPVTKHFLRDHDEIDVGRHKLVYYSGDFVGSERVDTSHGRDDAARDRATSDAIFEEPPLDMPNAVVAREGTLPLHALGIPRAGGASVDTGARFVSETMQPANENATELLDRPPPDAPTLEVLDGPSAGRQVTIANDTFVLGRVGVQVAAVERTPDGRRLVHVEGETRPIINGARLPDEGSLLALGDEIEVAGTRLVYRPAV